MGVLEDLYNQMFNNNQPQQQQQSYASQQDKIASFNASHGGGGYSAPQAGYRKMNDLERFFTNLQQRGLEGARSINRMLGIADENGDYDILGELQNIGDIFDENGNVDVGKVVTTPFRGLESASRVARALPGMAVQGWSESPAYMYSAATGSPIAQRRCLRRSQLVACRLGFDWYQNRWSDCEAAHPRGYRKSSYHG